MTITARLFLLSILAAAVLGSGVTAALDRIASPSPADAARAEAAKVIAVKDSATASQLRLVVQQMRALTGDLGELKDAQSGQSQALLRRLQVICKNAAPEGNYSSCDI